MSNRALGWIQDSTDLKKLKDIVNIFVPDSEINKRLQQAVNDMIVSNRKQDMLNQLAADKICIEYPLLVGRGPLKGETRKNASCTGIAQAALHSQNGRAYQSNWATNSFIVWAISIGFLDYDSITDCCSLSESGMQYALATDKNTELEILRKSFLSYPPVCGILRSLIEAPDNHLTKFEIGSNFGFVGEKGFTCFAQRFIIEGLNACENAQARRIFLTNTEGTSDKYVRTICSWLIQVGWIERHPKTVTLDIRGKKMTETLTDAYQITFQGRKDYNHAIGNSKYKQIPKIVYYSMLSPNGAGCEYMRQRRAVLISYLSKSYRSISDCLNYLSAMGINVTENAVADDIKGFSNIGLNVSFNGSGYQINDKIIKLEIPSNRQSVDDRSALSRLKEDVQDKLLNINHKFLSLIDYSYGLNNKTQKKADRLFELMTAELLTSELEFSGGRLGDSRKPDVCVYYGTKGLIIDNKAYSDGYNLPMNQADEMVRYLEENKAKDENLNSNKWWSIFSENVTSFNFAFISSVFSGGFRDRIKSIYNRTGISGAALNVINLLLLADAIKSKRISYNEALDLFNCNDEICIKF